MIFGGTDGTSYYNDIHIFDTTLMKWLELPIRGPLPSSRHRHSAVLVKSKMYMFGGLQNPPKAFQDMYYLSLPEDKLVDFCRNSLPRNLNFIICDQYSLEELDELEESCYDLLKRISKTKVISFLKKNFNEKSKKI